jgi:hypothetical protein
MTTSQQLFFLEDGREREKRGCLWLLFPLSKKKVKSKSEKRKKKYERLREKE